VLFGAFILVGWWLGADELTSFNPAWPKTDPLTALGIIACGVALEHFLLAKNRNGQFLRVAQMASVVAMFLGIMTFSYALASAAALFVTGASWLMLAVASKSSQEKQEKLSLIVSGIMAAISLMSLFAIAGYALGSPYVSMPAPSAAIFFLITIAVFIENYKTLPLLASTKPANR
jgi:hypothetical protein